MRFWPQTRTKRFNSLVSDRKTNSSPPFVPFAPLPAAPPEKAVFHQFNPEQERDGFLFAHKIFNPRVGSLWRRLLLQPDEESDQE